MSSLTGNTVSAAVFSEADGLEQLASGLEPLASGARKSLARSEVTADERRSLMSLLLRLKKNGMWCILKAH